MDMVCDISLLLFKINNTFIASNEQRTQYKTQINQANFDFSFSFRIKLTNRTLWCLNGKITVKQLSKSVVAKLKFAACDLKTKQEEM